MSHTLIEPIGQVRPGGLNASELVERIWQIVYLSGRTQVSMDIEGSVYATPAEHPFSKSTLRQYADRVVGVYTKDASVEDILGDLIEQWKTDREAAA